MKAEVMVLNKMEQILTEKDWCQDDFAIDMNGDAVSVDNPDAVAFCLLGAMLKSTKSGRMRELISERLKKAVGDVVSLWNDAQGRTKRQVLAAIRRARKAAYES